jgi:hypothetical protein
LNLRVDFSLVLRYLRNVNQITCISHEAPTHFFQFFNFVEYPGGADKKHGPTLYFSLIVRLNGARFEGIEHPASFMVNDIRLRDGGFLNPFRSTGTGYRAQAYFGSALARLIEEAWLLSVQPKMPKWSLVEGAWQGLVSDVEKIAKAMDTPYKVWTKEGSEKKRREKASRKVGLV